MQWFFLCFFIHSIFCMLVIHSSVIAAHASPPFFQIHTKGKVVKRESVSNEVDSVSNSSDVIPIHPTVVEETKNGTLHINANNTITNSLPEWMTTIKSGALQRTGFVVLGFMSFILIFFVVRSVRLRHKRSKSRKYGVITSTDMEMEPLDKDEDDEEEMTLFDAQHKYLK